MSDIINIEAKDVTAVYEDALQTHQRIMANSEICARSLLEVCKDLKKMRDEKLYEQFGYETFDNYCENMAGIKSRMAYNYISTYERLGATVLQSNANLGITKLELIAGMNPVERAEGLHYGTFENMSVSEIKELVKKNKEMGEQIDLLKEQLEETQSTDNVSEDCNESADEVSEYDAEKDELESRVVELENMLGKQKAEYEDKLDNLRDELEDKLREEIEEEYKSKIENESSKVEDNSAEIQKQIDEAVAAAKKETEKEVKAKYSEKDKKQKEKIKTLEEAISSADADKKTLEKQLALSDTKSAKAMVYIQSIQDNFNSLFALISDMDLEQQGKFKGAVLKLTNAMQEKAES